MNSILKLAYFSSFVVFVASCTHKKTEPTAIKNVKKDTTPLLYKKNIESIAGFYTTATEDDCHIAITLTTTQNGYLYTLKTNTRNVTGKAKITISESGEKYIVLEGIKWDEYEGDISHEEDSTTTRELEIPTGIEASYVQDTLTIQNYGNAMNYYTKLAECGAKYIQLVKK
ncbi:hypothetical protein SGQ44_01645 [Flavobacterium sp. Fl-77]|uniref:Lipoprotein n=1 Tax=Flavobacterium flavipigmentatum TaxID=2893884 RepID=A0AAJ2VWS6_9FLAO|nr:MULTISPECIES: hypothetical protein [unclassified Flavobacterium]MDX6180840.1 hypothetical protein [Flavobacterium sp. Fl-33]MDX6184440.1 hypothetical protein [Flavobacterium sp. Fl-77]UFH39549.1 hypothetical protein LNP22_04540 [Flavobacterium sp. F-70]